MKGRILDFSIQNSSGVISGDDGERYNFVASEWKSEKSPTNNQIVDFKVEGENAVGIYLDQNISTGDQKNKIVAAVLALFLGGLGIHKFYLGCNTAGIIMLVLFFGGFVLLGFPTLIISVIAFIEFILYLIKSDDDFQKIYIDNQKCWF